jgi:hypothetical protein
VNRPYDFHARNPKLETRNPKRSLPNNLLEILPFFGKIGWFPRKAEKISVDYLPPCLQKANPHRCGLSSSF